MWLKVRVCFGGSLRSGARLGGDCVVERVRRTHVCGLLGRPHKLTKSAGKFDARVPDVACGMWRTARHWEGALQGCGGWVLEVVSVLSSWGWWQCS